MWKLPPGAAQLEHVLAGCQGKYPEFQAYCIYTLADGLRTGTDLSSVLSRQMALSHIWQVYTAPKGASFEAVAACENVFWNTFRGAGWELYPPRYPVLRQAVRKVIDERREIQHNVFDHMLTAAVGYPDYARENYKLLLTVLDSPIEIYKFGTAQRFSLVYQPNTTDIEMQTLNGEILRKLSDLLVHKNASVADGAAIAIGYIALDHARVGSVPKEIAGLLARVSDGRVDGNVKSRLLHAQQELRAVKPQDLGADTQPLSFPWDNLLNRKIVAHGLTCFRDGKHGASVEIGGRRLWIDGLNDWLDAIRGNTRITVTGKLAKVHDLDVFRYEPGKPFGVGLPVPEGYSLESARQRYVLRGASWHVSN